MSENHPTKMADFHQTMGAPGPIVGPGKPQIFILQIDGYRTATGSAPPAPPMA
jgi:hypothetical protein